MIKIVVENKDGRNVMGVLKPDGTYSYTAVPAKTLDDLRAMLDKKSNGKAYELVVSEINPPVWG